MSSPVLQSLFLFLGSYFLLNILAKIHPLLAVLAAIFAGVCAATIWMRLHDADRLFQLTRNSVAEAVATRICKWARLQPPTPARDEIESPVVRSTAAAWAVEPAMSATAVTEHSRTHPVAGRVKEKEDAKKQRKLIPETDEDFARIGEELQEIVHGHSANITRLVRRVRDHVRIRERSQRHATMPPILSALFLGPRGVGKRYLAEQLGRQLYGPRNVLTIDLAESGDHLGTLLEAVRVQPFLTVILDNVDRADPILMERLEAILRKGTLATEDGKLVDYRFVFLFLVAAKSAESVTALQAADGGAAMTMELSAVSNAASLTLLLATWIHETLFFSFPTNEHGIRIVSQVMHEVAAQANLELAYVDPQVLAREVKAAIRAESFELTPGRVRKRMHPFLAAAHAADQSHVDVLSDPQAEDSGSIPIPPDSNEIEALEHDSELETHAEPRSTITHSRAPSPRP